MSERVREVADADRAAVDVADDAAEHARAAALARAGMESAEFLLCIRYDPESASPFRFSNLTGSGPATWDSVKSVMSYSNCRGGEEGVCVWKRWSRVYHTTGRPLGHLSVLVCDHMCELADVKTVRTIHEFDMSSEYPIFFA